MADRPNRILEAAVRVIAQDGVRGLRVEKLAAEAGVSTALIYYYFKDRAGILDAALAHIHRSAEAYTSGKSAAADPRGELEQMLLRELQDSERVRRNSVAWGELRASAVFNPHLREPLQAATGSWVEDAAGLIRQAQAAGAVGPAVVPVDAAERLTALVEGLSGRWHSGSIGYERARDLLAAAIAVELGPG